MKCLICGEASEKPLRSTLSHLRLYSPGKWKYLRGNIQTFGLWIGFWGTVYLASPLLNTLRHWKYRKCSLSIRDPR